MALDAAREAEPLAGSPAAAARVQRSLEAVLRARARRQAA
jgi:hypothetical protein